MLVGKTWYQMNKTWSNCHHKEIPKLVFREFALLSLWVQFFKANPGSVEILIVIHLFTIRRIFHKIKVQGKEICNNYKINYL